MQANFYSITYPLLLCKTHTHTHLNCKINRLKRVLQFVQVYKQISTTALVASCFAVSLVCYQLLTYR